MVVLGISIVLLLIASTNLMNLLFARGVARLREMSIRRAIGSTSWRLLRQLLIESLVLAAAGGLLGLLLASFAIKAIVALSPVHLPVTQSIDIDGTVLAFAMLLCVGTAIVAGFLPALHVSARTLDAVRSTGHARLEQSRHRPRAAGVVRRPDRARHGPARRRGSARQQPVAAAPGRAGLRHQPRARLQSVGAERHLRRGACALLPRSAH